MWGLWLSYLRRTKLTLQTLLLFRSRLVRMSRLMILGSENLVSIIHIFIEHPAHILGIRVLMLVMIIVLTSTWQIMTTFYLHLRIMRELTLALILAFSVIRKRALNYLSAANIVRDIITVCVSHFIMWLVLGYALIISFTLIFFCLDWRFWFIFLSTCIFYYLL